MNTQIYGRFTIGSKKFENIVNNVKKIALKGFREIVLTGINLGDFGNLKGKLKEKVVKPRLHKIHSKKQN